MKRLLIYLKNYKKECVLGPLFKLLEASFELIVPLIIAAIVDNGIDKGDRGYIGLMCGVLVLLGVVGLIFSVTAQYFSAKAAVGFSTGVKHALFEHIQNLSYSQLDKIGTSTLITRITSDVNQVQSGVNMVLRLLLRSPFVVFGAMIMAFTIDVKAALIFVVTIILLSIVIFGIMLISIPLYKKVQENLDRILLTTRENLVGSRVIRAFCKEEEEISKFRTRNEENTASQKYVGRISALLNPMTYIIINISVVVLIYVGAIRVDMGSLTQGQVIALYNYMSQILVELIKLANLIVNINKSLACANRIADVLGTPAEERTGTYKCEVTGPAKVEFKNVCMVYEGSKEEALTNVTFTAAPGDVVGVIGGTGSGKSTLINLIPGFYKATKGRILINDVDIMDYDPECLEKHVAVVPQKAVLFAGSIRDNLRWGNADAQDDELWEALTISQGREVVEGKDGKLDYLLTQQGKNLSGGQRQRLTIARALVKKAGILILDDSSSALDYATDARLRAALKGMKDAPTTFIVSQRTSSISHADLIIVLDDGEVAGMGTHDELLKTCETYKEIHYSQFTGKEEGHE